VVSPIYNGLTDHDTQLIKIHDIGFKEHIYNTHNIRRINQNSLADFKYNLSFELWKASLMKRMEITYLIPS
jgi:hypothetical protein